MAPPARLANPAPTPVVDNAKPPPSDSQDTSDTESAPESEAGTWFLQFPPFVYDSTADLESNFDRLAADRKWGAKLKAKRWAQCQEEVGGSDVTQNTQESKTGIWFLQFLPFLYDHTTDLQSNFNRLAEKRQWGAKLKAKRWRQCQEEVGHAHEDDAIQNAQESKAGTWFLQFPPFVYDRSAGLQSNFNRLAADRKWGKKLKSKRWVQCQEEELGHAHKGDAIHKAEESKAGTWFLQFPPFVYDRSAGLQSNFKRLAADRNWGKRTKAKRWAQCQEEEFGHAYGGDITKLESWQDLCREVHISDPPNSISQCKAALGARNVWVNLVNLIDHRNTGVEVIRFKSYPAFQRYTRDGRIFPKERAKKEGFIKALLRVI